MSFDILNNKKNTSKNIIFDRSCIPKSLMAYVDDVSSQLGVPVEMVVVTALTVIAGAVSNKCGLRPLNTSWTLIPNLWGAIIAPPGSNKSAVIKAMQSPILSSELEEYDKYNDLHDQFLKDKKKYDSDIKEYAKKIKFDDSVPEPSFPAKPKRKRFIVNDSTYEMMGQLLQESDQGLLAVFDELGSLLSSFNGSARAGDETRKFYLSAWDGDQSVSVDRIGRGSFYIKNLCLSVFGGIQPSEISNLVKDAVSGKKSDGLLERFQLLVYPEFSSTYHFYDAVEDLEAKKTYGSSLRKLLSFDPITFGATKIFEDDRPFFKFSENAKKKYIKFDMERFAKKHEANVSKNYTLESYYAKQQVLVGSLSLLFHLWEISDGTISPTSKVDEINIERALKLSSFLEEHTKKIYSLSEEQDEEHDRALHEIIEFARLNKDDVEGHQYTFSELGRKLHRSYTAVIVKEALSQFIVKTKGNKIVELKF